MRLGFSRAVEASRGIWCGWRGIEFWDRVTERREEGGKGGEEIFYWNTIWTDPDRSIKSIITRWNLAELSRCFFLTSHDGSYDTLRRLRDVWKLAYMGSLSLFFFSLFFSFFGLSGIVFDMCGDAPLPRHPSHIFPNSLASQKRVSQSCLSRPPRRDRKLHLWKCDYRRWAEGCWPRMHLSVGARDRGVYFADLPSALLSRGHNYLEDGFWA